MSPTNHLTRKKGKSKVVNKDKELIETLQTSVTDLKKQVEELEKYKHKQHLYRRMTFATNTIMNGESMPSYATDAMRKLLQSKFQYMEQLSSAAEALKRKVLELEKELQNKDNTILAKEFFIKQYKAVIEDYKSQLENTKNQDEKYKKENCIKESQCKSTTKKCLDAYSWAIHLGKCLINNIPIKESDATLIKNIQEQLDSKVPVLEICDIPFENRNYEEDGDVTNVEKLPTKHFEKSNTVIDELGVLSPPLTDEGVGLSPVLSVISTDNSCSNYKDTYQTYGPLHKEESSKNNILSIGDGDHLNNSKQSLVQESIDVHSAHLTSGNSSLFDPDLANIADFDDSLDEGICSLSPESSSETVPKEANCALNMPTINDSNSFNTEAVEHDHDYFEMTDHVLFDKGTFESDKMRVEILTYLDHTQELIICPKDVVSSKRESQPCPNLGKSDLTCENSEPIMKRLQKCNEVAHEKLTRTEEKFNNIISKQSFHADSKIDLSGKCEDKTDSIIDEELRMPIIVENVSFQSQLPIENEEPVSKGLLNEENDFNSIINDVLNEEMINSGTMELKFKDTTLIANSIEDSLRMRNSEQLLLVGNVLSEPEKMDTETMESNESTLSLRKENTSDSESIGYPDSKRANDCKETTSMSKLFEDPVSISDDEYMKTTLAANSFEDPLIMRDSEQLLLKDNVLSVQGKMDTETMEPKKSTLQLRKEITSESKLLGYPESMRASDYEETTSIPKLFEDSGSVSEDEYKDTISLSIPFEDPLSKKDSEELLLKNGVLSEKKNVDTETMDPMFSTLSLKVCSDRCTNKDTVNSNISKSDSENIIGSNESEPPIKNGLKNDDIDVKMSSDEKIQQILNMKCNYMNSYSRLANSGLPEIKDSIKKIEVDDKILNKILAKMRIKSNRRVVSPIPPSPKFSKQESNIQMELSMLALSDSDENSSSKRQIEKVEDSAEIHVSVRTKAKNDSTAKYVSENPCDEYVPDDAKSQFSEKITEIPITIVERNSKEYNLNEFKTPSDQYSKSVRCLLNHLPSDCIESSINSKSSLSSNCNNIENEIISHDLPNLSTSEGDKSNSSSYSTSCSSGTNDNISQYQTIISETETSKQSYNSNASACSTRLLEGNSIKNYDSIDAVIEERSCLNADDVHHESNTSNENVHALLNLPIESDLNYIDIEILLAKIHEEFYPPDCIEEFPDLENMSENIVHCPKELTHELGSPELDGLKNMQENPSFEESNDGVTNNSRFDSIDLSSITESDVPSDSSYNQRNETILFAEKNHILSTGATNQFDSMEKYSDCERYPSNDASFSKSDQFSGIETKTSNASTILIDSSANGLDSIDCIEKETCDSSRFSCHKVVECDERSSRNKINSISKHFNDSDESDFEGWPLNEVPKGNIYENRSVQQNTDKKRKYSEGIKAPVRKSARIMEKNRKDSLISMQKDCKSRKSVRLVGENRKICQIPMEKCCESLENNNDDECTKMESNQITRDSERTSNIENKIPQVHENNVSKKKSEKLWSSSQTNDKNKPSDEGKSTEIKFDEKETAVDCRKISTNKSIGTEVSPNVDGDSTTFKVLSSRLTIRDSSPIYSCQSKLSHSGSERNETLNEFIDLGKTPNIYSPQNTSTRLRFPRFSLLNLEKRKNCEEIRCCNPPHLNFFERVAMRKTKTRQPVKNNANHISLISSGNSLSHEELVEIDLKKQSELLNRDGTQLNSNESKIVLVESERMVSLSESSSANSIESGNPLIISNGIPENYSQGAVSYQNNMDMIITNNSYQSNNITVNCDEWMDNGDLEVDFEEKQLQDENEASGKTGEKNVEMECEEIPSNESRKNIESNGFISRNGQCITSICMNSSIESTRTINSNGEHHSGADECCKDAIDDCCPQQFSKVPLLNFYTEATFTPVEKDERSEETFDSTCSERKKRELVPSESSEPSQDEMKPELLLQSSVDKCDDTKCDYTKGRRMIPCENAILTAYKYHSKFLCNRSLPKRIKFEETINNESAEQIFIRIVKAKFKDEETFDEADEKDDTADEEWTSELIGICMEGLKGIRNEMIVELIIDALHADDGEPDFEAFGLLNNLQKKLITVTHLLCCDISDHPNFFKTLMKSFKYFLLMNQKPREVDLYCNCARFLTVLCRNLGKTEEMRWFIYDALYYKKMNGIAMVFSALCMWPTLLPAASSENAYPLDLCISQVLMKCHTRDKPGDRYKSEQVDKLLKLYYGYQEKNVDQLFNELMERINVSGALEAIILLCKRIGPKWTLSNVVEKSLLPVLIKWKAKKNNNGAVKNIMIILSKIMRPFMQGHKSATFKRVIEVIGNILLDPEGDGDVQEVAAFTICKLFNGSSVQCTELLINWRPRNGIVSEELVQKMRVLISKRKPIVWLKLLAQSNRLNALMNSKA